MPSAIVPLLVQLLVVAILASLFWILVVRVIAKERAKHKSPFTRNLLRAPGESCSKKLAELDDLFWESNAQLFSLFAFVSGLALGLLTPALKSPLAMITFGGLAIAAAILKMGQIRKAIRARDNFRLGQEGEKHTAQALLPLLGQGYEMYHDIEFKDSTGKTFNLDHVLIGPAGVVVVETKARSKASDAKGTGAAAVRYDGKQIRFPTGLETAALDQVLANAKRLSRELTAHTGESVYVRAAVSLPGWFVTQTAKEVNPVVHNPEMLRSWIERLPVATMSVGQRNRIRGYLARA